MEGWTWRAIARTDVTANKERYVTPFSALVTGSRMLIAKGEQTCGDEKPIMEQVRRSS